MTLLSYTVVKKFVNITLDPDPNSKYLDPQQWNEIWPKKSLNHEKVGIYPEKIWTRKKKHMNVIHEKSGARHLSKTSLDILQTMYALSASTLCRKKRLMTRQLGQHFCRITAISSKTYSRYRPIKYQYLHVCFGMHTKKQPSGAATLFGGCRLLMSLLKFSAKS